MKVDQELTMAYPRKLVEHVILGLYDQINIHLVKLAGYDFPDDLRKHFKKELRAWLDKIQSLRFKPNYRTGSYKFYFDLFFDYPFGGVEIENMRRIMRAIESDCEWVKPAKTPEEMVDWLRRFHQELAERLHEGEDVLDLIPA